MSSRTERRVPKRTMIDYENIQVRQQKMVYWIEEEVEGEWFTLSETITQSRKNANMDYSVCILSKNRNFRLVNQMCMVVTEGIGRKFNTKTRERIKPSK